MTTQEAFDRIVKHLLTQNARSENPNAASSGPRCLYRGLGNLKCAVSCLIPHHLYEPELEGWNAAQVADLLPSVFSGVSREILNEAQYIHDFNSVDSWPHNLRKLAMAYGLTYPEM